MNRIVKELMGGGRNTTADGNQQRRLRSLTTMKKDIDENLDLFSKNRRSLSVLPSDESEVAAKLGKPAVGLTRTVKSGLDDLITSSDGEKHDYDWLLTPPGTPTFTSSDGSEPNQILGASRSRSLARSVSTTKASRLSATQPDSNPPSRPIRSNSVTRTAVSTKSSPILNTSSSSVKSYIRPSSPITRSPSTAKPSTPSAKPTSIRPTTPSRTRPTPTSTSSEKAKPSQITRQSTPTRPKILSNLSSPAAQPNARPSTPTRRIPPPASSAATSGPASAGRVSSNGRTSAPVSRPSSPGPKVRSTSQPPARSDLLNAPSNLRTTLPGRPLSAGRSRPGLSATAKVNTDRPSSVNLPKRQPSPTITRGKLTNPSSRGLGPTNGHVVNTPESRKPPPVSELAKRKPVKSSTAGAESTGFGRNISKKSLDMAIKHMDIRTGKGGNRPHSGATVFPQSIRSTPSKTTSRASSTLSSPAHSICGMSDNEMNVKRSPENGADEKSDHLSGKISEVDIYESSRYDAIMLKEDLKNTYWLHSDDDNTNHGALFDNGFESLPEPFSPL